MNFRTKHLLPLFLASAAPLAAQGRPVVVTRIGDTLPAGDAITSMLNARIANSGDYMLQVGTDNANPDKRKVLIRNGNALVRSGTAAPGGGTWESFRGIDMDDDGDVLVHGQLENVPGYGSITEGLFYNGQPFLYEQDVTGASGFGAGSFYTELKAVNLNDARQVLLRCDVHDTNLGFAVGVLMRLDLDAGGAIQSETALIKEPQIPVGQSHGIVDFPGTTVGQAALNNSGGGLWSARLDPAAGSQDDVCYFNTSTLVAQSDSPSVVVPGRNWGDIGSPFVDANATPSWVAKLRLDSTDTSDDRLILQNGNIYVREGSPAPAFPGSTVLDLGTMNAWITDADEVAYWLRWDGPPPTSEALMVGADVMARKNITTTASGEVVEDFVMVTEGFVISDDGDRIMYQAFLDTGDHAMLIGQRDLGESYCSAEPNSTGTFSTTSAKGSTHVVFNALRLETVDLPANQFSYYLASQTQDDVPFAGGSSGRLCLGGNIGRFSDQVKSTGAAGELRIWVDLTNIPGNPPSTVQPGDTWNFQAWHRDGGTSNFSLPISVTFD